MNVMKIKVVCQSIDVICHLQNVLGGQFISRNSWGIVFLKRSCMYRKLQQKLQLTEVCFKIGVKTSCSVNLRINGI